MQEQEELQILMDLLLVMLEVDLVDLETTL
jgi:hypothetical protein